MKTSVQSPVRHQEGPLECKDTTTMLCRTAKATANSTFYTVFMVFWRKIMAAAVFFSLHSNNLSQLFNDCTTTQMVHIHNYSCIRKS